MTDPMHNSELVRESTKKAKDGRTRKAMLLLGLLWLGLVTFLIVDSRMDAAEQQKTTLSFAEEIQNLCKTENIKSGLCGDADKVVKNDGDVTAVVGPKGDKGDTGAQGPQGPKGDKGEKGDPGKNGQNGSDGLAGLDGLMGAIGLQGPQGEPGEQGIQGEPGLNGVDGKDGADGAKGETGPPGPTGKTGVVAVNTVNCDGPMISSVTSAYNADTQTITLTCNSEGANNE